MASDPEEVGLNEAQGILRESYLKLTASQDDKITPDEFAKNINFLEKNFLLKNSWKTITGEALQNNIISSFNLLTTEIDNYNKAKNLNDNNGFQIALTEIKNITYKIIGYLDSVKNEKQKEQEGLDSIKKNQSEYSKSEIVNTSTTYQVGILKHSPLAHDTGSKTIKKLNSDLDDLLERLPKLTNNISNWKQVTDNYKDVTILIIMSNILLDNVDNYNRDWSKFLIEVNSDYKEIGEKIKEDNNIIVNNFEKLCDTIKELKKTTNDIMVINEEIYDKVKAVIKFIRDNLQNMSRGGSS